MEAAQLTNALVGLVIAGVIGGVVILIVSSLNLGLSVRGFGPAFVAAVAIAIVGAVIRFVLEAIGVPSLGGTTGFVERVIISALGLIIAGRLLDGLSVHGYKGAIIAALAIGVLAWLFGLFLQAMGIGVTV